MARNFLKEAEESGIESLEFDIGDIDFTVFSMTVPIDRFLPFVTIEIVWSTPDG